jgi:hypothetical protein
MATSKWRDEITITVWKKSNYKNWEAPPPPSNASVRGMQDTMKDGKKNPINKK